MLQSLSMSAVISCYGNLGRWRKGETEGRVLLTTDRTKGHVTRGNFCCNLSCNKRCETSCKKNFTCNTPFLQPATATKCCVSSCKKRRNILNSFATLRDKLPRVTCQSQLAKQFCENEAIRVRLSLAGDFKLAEREL